MIDYVAILILFPVIAVVLIGIGMVYDTIYWWLRRKVDCECKTPRNWSPLGSTYICDDCALYWYSTHDNVCWAGWAYAPWWKRTQMRLGWEKEGRRKEADTEPLTKEQKEEDSFLKAILNGVRRI